MGLAWYVLAGFAALAFTVMALLIKNTLVTVPAERLLFYIFVLGAVILFLKGIVTGQNLTVSPVELGVLVVIAVCSVLGNLFTYASYATAPNPGYTAAVSSINIVLITVLSFLLLGSKLDARGLVGTVLVLAGVVLLTAKL